MAHGYLLGAHDDFQPLLRSQGDVTKLDAPWLRAWVYRRPIDPARHSHWWLAAAVGEVSTALVAALLQLWPTYSTDQAVAAAGWARRALLASFYGDIVEEVECRLLRLSLIARLLAWLRHTAAATWMFTLAVTSAALLFGAGHLPAAFAIRKAHSVPVIGKILLLNLVVGVVTGMPFWNCGLEHATLTHFSADLVLHVPVTLLGLRRLRGCEKFNFRSESDVRRS
jgi:hypothetical protein